MLEFLCANVDIFKETCLIVVVREVLALLIVILLYFFLISDVKHTCLNDY